MSPSLNLAALHQRLPSVFHDMMMCPSSPGGEKSTEHCARTIRDSYTLQCGNIATLLQRKEKKEPFYFQFKLKPHSIPISMAAL